MNVISRVDNYIYIYNEIEKRENNHFTFHFSGINILASKNFEKTVIDMTDCIRSLLINCSHL